MQGRNILLSWLTNRNLARRRHLGRYFEEIVGNIDDENDVSVSGVRPQPDGSFLINGSVTLRDLNRDYEWNLPDEEASTIAGSNTPRSSDNTGCGQEFIFYSFRFRILRKHRNQITQLRVWPRPKQIWFV